MTHRPPRRRLPTLRRSIASLLGATLLASVIAAGPTADAAQAARRPTGDLATARVVDPTDAVLSQSLGHIAQRLAAGPRRPAPTADQQAQATFIGNNFYDFCDDNDGFDLKKFSIIDDQAAEVILVWGTCPQSPAPQRTGDAVAFIIDDGQTYDNRPNLVVVQDTVDGRFVVYDTNGSGREVDWTAIDDGQGTITAVGSERGGPRTVGEIPIDALASNYPLQYLVAMATFDADGVGDVVPEPGMPPIAFPFSCDYFTLHAATVTVEGRLGPVLAAARKRGLHVSQVDGRAGTFLASGASNADLAALRSLPGVAARRPAMFEDLATGDPEPTQWALDQTRLEEAWTAVPRAASTIAILDQGVDGTRTDLGGRVVAGWDTYRGTPFATGADSSLGPHGTAVAGVAAANRGNGADVVGVNEGANILPVVVFDHANCANDTSIAAGLDWAVDHGAQIINLSLGGPQDTAVLREAVERAVAAGVIVIAATGNDQGVNPNTVSYPAGYPDVIGIGASAPGDDGPIVASYSQHSGTDHVLPGGISSGARASDMAVLSEWDQVAFQAGTSFAAPYAAGLVSLWLSQHPGASTAQVRRALTGASTDLDGSGDGNGLVDAVALLGSKPAVEPEPVDRVPAAPAIDGDPATSHRLTSDDPVVAALAMSALRFPADGSAPNVVLARRDNFADALSGAPLSARGPLLFTDSNVLDRRVRHEVSRVLADGGTIHLLGGTAAISEQIATTLAQDRPDAAVKRLGGANRFETSRAIVRETVAINGRARQILLARGYGPAADPNGTAAWADAIAGGAYAASRRFPILVVQSARLGPTDLAVLDEVVTPDGIVNLLGGTSALSGKVFDAAATVRTTRRIRGADRSATAAAIANTLWGVLPESGPRNFVVFNPHVPSGWSLGLASAGYAAQIGAPMVAVASDIIPASTRALVTRCDTKQVEQWIAGTTTQVPSPIAFDLESLDGIAC